MINNIWGSRTEQQDAYIYKVRNEASTLTGTLDPEDPYMPPPREAYDPVTRKWYTYQGSGIVLANGRLWTDAQKNPVYYTEAYAEQMLYNSSAANRAVLIQKLVNAGYLSDTQVGDTVSEGRALYNAMMTANFNGRDVLSVLNRIAEGRPITPKRGPVRTYTKTNSQDLVKAVKDISVETLGRELSDAEAQQFAQNYQAQEIAYQRAAYGGGTVTQPPSLDTAARSFIQGAQPKEESAYRYLGYMNMLFDSVGSV